MSGGCQPLTDPPFFYPSGRPAILKRAGENGRSSNHIATAFRRAKPILISTRSGQNKSSSSVRVATLNSPSYGTSRVPIMCPRELKPCREMFASPELVIRIAAADILVACACPTSSDKEIAEMVGHSPHHSLQLS